MFLILSQHTRRAAVIPSIRNNKEDGNKLECPQETSDFVRNRIVHFDLKGAPPQLEYYQQLFPLLRQLGATGILLEYEDMFPYHGRLGAWKNRNAYTVDNIRSIINWARQEQLIVIPLVQSFGHLEWILKVEENEQYREDARYPQV
jgi:hexosaminidase